MGRWSQLVKTKITRRLPEMGKKPWRHMCHAAQGGRKVISEQGKHYKQILKERKTGRRHPALNREGKCLQHTKPLEEGDMDSSLKPGHVCLLKPSVNNKQHILMSHVPSSQVSLYFCLLDRLCPRQCDIILCELWDNSAGGTEED